MIPKRFLVRVLLICAACTLASGASVRAQSWNPDVAIPTDSSFVVGRLDNGFTYYIKANRRPEKRAELRLAVNAGSVCEDDDQRGLAHFVEHMAFNGTAHFQKQELVDYMESIGMRFGPEVNASTGFDETLYQLFVPTDSLPVLEKGFLILEDWAQGVSFEDEAIDKERGVVVEEWRLGRGANARIRDRQFPVLLHGSKYADRLPIGEKAVIDTFHHETLRRFYRDWYRPDLMAVIAVGDFDPVEIEALVRRHFSNLPRPTLSRVRELYAIPDHDETLYAIASDPEATGASVSLYVKRPLEAEATLSDFRRSLIEELLDGMMNQRLDELTKSADPPFIFGLSGNGRMLRTKSVTLLSATVEENGIERGLEALLTESRRVREFGFTQTELDRQKADLLRLTERAYDEQDKTESSVFTDRAVDRFLEDRALPGAAAALRLTRLLLPTILLEDVSGFARGSITRANRVILASAPKKEGVRIPTESDIVAVAGRVEAAPLAAYLDRVSDRPLLETDLPPGRIIRTRFFPSIRTTEWTLSNGTRVVLKPTDFKNDQVLFRAFRFGGHSLVPDSDYIASVTAVAVLNEGGWGSFSAVELEKKLAGKIVGCTPQLDELSEGMTGSASPKDLETLLQLAVLQFISPRRDSTSFGAYRARLKAFLQNRSLRPESAFRDTLQVLLTQRHFRGKPFTVSDLGEMNLDASLRIYRERFANPGGFTFFLTGAFEIDRIEPMVLATLGGLPPRTDRETWRDNGMSAPQGFIEKTVRKGIEPKARAALVFTGPYDWSPKHNIVFQSLADAARIKLREVLRENMGGTYGVSVGGSGERIPKPEYSLSISFGCSPERVDELIRAVRLQIDSLRTFGPNPLLLQKVKEAQLREYETDLRENGYWIGRLLESYYDGQNPESVLTYPKLVKKTDAKSIRNAARQWFNPKNVVQVVLLPDSSSSGPENTGP